MKSATRKIDNNRTARSSQPECSVIRALAVGLRSAWPGVGRELHTKTQLTMSNNLQNSCGVLDFFPDILGTANNSKPKMRPHEHAKRTDEGKGGTGRKSASHQLKQANLARNNGITNANHAIEHASSGLVGSTGEVGRVERTSLVGGGEEKAAARPGPEKGRECPEGGGAAGSPRVSKSAEHHNPAPAARPQSNHYHYPTQFLNSKLPHPPKRKTGPGSALECMVQDSCGLNMMQTKRILTPERSQANLSRSARCELTGGRPPSRPTRRPLRGSSSPQDLGLCRDTKHLIGPTQ